MRFADHPTALSDPSTGLVAIAWNGGSQSFGMAGRDQSESVVAITRCAHSVAMSFAEVGGSAPEKHGAAHRHIRIGYVTVAMRMVASIKKTPPSRARAGALP